MQRSTIWQDISETMTFPRWRHNVVIQWVNWCKVEQLQYSGIMTILGVDRQFSDTNCCGCVVNGCTTTSISLTSPSLSSRLGTQLTDIRHTMEVVECTALLPGRSTQSCWQFVTRWGVTVLWHLEQWLHIDVFMCLSFFRSASHRCCCCEIKSIRVYDTGHSVHTHPQQAPWIMLWQALQIMSCQALMIMLWQALSIMFWLALRINEAQYNTIQYNTIQYNTIQYNTIQYNTNPKFDPYTEKLLFGCLKRLWRSCWDKLQRSEAGTGIILWQDSGIILWKVLGIVLWQAL